MYTIIILIIGFALGYWYAQTRKKDKPQMNQKAQEFHRKKEENKKKIIAYLKENAPLRSEYRASGDKKEDHKHTITNNDVEELLGVGDTSAYKYLEELQQEGVINQIGKEGRSVYYKLR